MKIMIN